MSAGPDVRVRRVQVLDATLANQIAAGEVVERPASVLKELMENSLDAGAARLRVEVSRGGAALVRVSDDGTGIPAADLALALERHATSKITTLDELEAVRSMGFRGEALPSIASVARLRMESRAADADGAWCIEAEGGPPRSGPVPAAHPAGTSVSVRDLFFNTPVRRRFLKTPRTEFRHLDRVFRRLALSAFPVAMTLVHDGREVLRLPAAGNPAACRRRVARILGSAFAHDAVALDRSAAGMRVWGWLGAPDQARERSELQHLFVNARPVADATVRHAVRLGYGDRLAQGRQPAWLLYLEMDPREVDVNVHPAKHEVRFHEARMVHDLVRSAVARALAGECREDGESRTPAPSRSAQPRDGRELEPRVAGSSLEVLAVLADGLVVARRHDRLLLARAGELRRQLARRTLAAAIERNVPPVSRPLLIPERLTPSAVPVRPALEALGFGFRDAGQALLLLAVPECMATVPPAELVALLDPASGWPLEPAGWLEPLASLAARSPVNDAGEAARLLRALGADADGDGPWTLLDAASLPGAG